MKFTSLRNYKLKVHKNKTLKFSIECTCGRILSHSVIIINYKYNVYLLIVCNCILGVSKKYV